MVKTALIPLPPEPERTRELLDRLDEAVREVRMLKAQIEDAQTAEMAPTLRADATKRNGRVSKP